MRSPSKQPVPLRGETRVAILATRTHAKRVDDEYERRGTASIFLFAEPLCAFRQATARPQRTQSDWALEVAHLWDTRQAKCEAVTRASDNLHTHTRGAFYEAFPPEQARASVKRLDLVHTPKHGSGLRLLNELSSERNCSDRQARHRSSHRCLMFRWPMTRPMSLDSALSENSVGDQPLFAVSRTL